jgi:hypothetical protein
MTMKLVDGVLVPMTQGEEAELAFRLNPPLDIRAARRKREVDAIRDVHLVGGFTVSAEVSTDLSGKVLQTRDVEDRTNWLTSQAAYFAAVSSGQGGTLGATFRAADNSTVTVSYSEGLGVLLAMAAWGAAVYSRSWALKDIIDAAEDDTNLDEIDITTGWPA